MKCSISSLNKLANDQLVIKITSIIMTNILIYLDVSILHVSNYFYIHFLQYWCTHAGSTLNLHILKR